MYTHTLVISCVCASEKNSFIRWACGPYCGLSPLILLYKYIPGTCINTHMHIYSVDKDNFNNKKIDRKQRNIYIYIYIYIYRERERETKGKKKRKKRLADLEGRWLHEDKVHSVRPTSKNC